MNTFKERFCLNFTRNAWCVTILLYDYTTYIMTGKVERRSGKLSVGYKTLDKLNQWRGRTYPESKARRAHVFRDGSYNKWTNWNRKSNNRSKNPGRVAEVTRRGNISRRTYVKRVSGVVQTRRNDFFTAKTVKNVFKKHSLIGRLIKKKYRRVKQKTMILRQEYDYSFRVVFSFLS